MWLPSRPLRRILGWNNKWESPDDNVNPEDEEDPGELTRFNKSSWELIYACLFIDFVAGIETESVLLGETSRRDPDALPPRTWAGRVCRLIYVIIHSLGHGNAVFAFKAGIMAGKSIHNSSINIRKF